MEILLFCIYLVLFSCVVARVKFFVNSGIPKPQLVIIFLINVIVGIFYGWMGLYQSNVNHHIADTWAFHFAGLRHNEILFNNPSRYFDDIFISNYGNGGLFESTNSNWNNLKGNAFIKILSIFDCFSFGNYFINVIFYCFIVLFGTVAVFRVMKDHLHVNQLLLILCCFFVPSFFYWNNGIHKDGICFLDIGLIIYTTYFYFNRNIFSFKAISIFLTACLLLFIFKNHLLVIILPALFAWYLAEKFPRKRFIVFAIVYGLGFLCFFGAKYVFSSIDPAQIFVNKQDDFNALVGGRSSIKVEKLEPTISGFVKLLPQAIELSSLRPYYSDINNWQIVPGFIELIILGLLLFVALFFIIKRRISISAFGLFICAFCISVLLTIGYTVNNLGAISRYRSVVFPLIVPMFGAIIYQEKLKYYNKYYTSKY